MQRSRAIVGTAVFFVVAPGVFAGLIPWWITGWELRDPIPGWAVARAIGVVLIPAGIIPLAYTFAQFAKAGGTPAPIAPPEHLVVHWYEEPTLLRTFGAEYEQYRRAVPGWRPRLRPWNPDT